MVSDAAPPPYPPPAGPVVSHDPLPPARPIGLAALRSELRADLQVTLRLVAVLALSGIPAGLLWWLLAPRVEVRVTSPGRYEAIERVSEEFRAADDGVYVLVLAGLGLLAGLAAWWLLRRRRGVTVLLGLAAGTAAAALVAWQLGEALAPSPPDADLQTGGDVVKSGLGLASTPAALMVAPFAAVLAYVAGTLIVSGEDLNRS